MPGHGRSARCVEKQISKSKDLGLENSMQSTQLRKYYEQYIIERAGVVLSLLLLFALVMSIFIYRFELDASADSLTLEGDEDVEYYRLIRDRFPSSDDFLVIAFTPDAALFDPETIDRLKMLKEELVALGGVKAVNSILDVPMLHHPDISLTNVTDHLLTIEEDSVPLDEARESLLSNPLYHNMLLSPDGKTTAIQIVLKSNPEYERLVRRREFLREKRDTIGLTSEEGSELLTFDMRIKVLNQENIERNRQDIQAIREIMSRYQGDARLFLGGVPMIVVDMIDYVRSDLRTFGLGVLLFLIATLVIIFRKLRWVVLPLFCCLVTCLVMTGYLGMARFPVTVISSNFISLLLIITMSMIIHLVVRYREYVVKYPDYNQKQLVMETVAAMSRPCLYTSLTTMVAFGSLLISGIRPVIDFGYMMTVGIVIAYCFTFLLFPLIMVLTPKEPPVPVSDDDSYSVWFARLTRAMGNKLLILAIGLGMICGVGISMLSVENRFIDYFQESTEIHQGMKVIDQELGGTTPLDVVIQFDLAVVEPTDEDDEDCFLDDECMDDVYGDSTFFTQERVDLLNEIHEYLESLPESGKVLSVATTIQIAEQIKGGKLETLELAFLNGMFPDDLRGLLLEPYINEHSGEARFTMRVKESDHSLKRQVLLDKIEQALQERFGLERDNFRFTSLVVLYNNMLQSLFRSQILTIGFVFVCIMAMFLVLFRSLYVALIAIIPNMFAPAVVLGMMGLLGIPLDMMTITIAAISVGIAVDNTIHYVYRFRMEVAKDGDYQAAMFRSHGSIGKAMYYTSLTIILGFSILAFSNFMPTIYFGLFTGLAMLIALFASLTLLPQLLILLKPFGRFDNKDQPEGEPS